MLGVLNLSAYGFLVGAMGQAWLLQRAWPAASTGWLLLPLCGPWLLVHAISFCNQPPCGPRRFRLCLLFAMGWHLAAAVGAEAACWVFADPLAPAKVPAWVAHLLTGLGFLPFIPLSRACLFLKRLEAEPPP